MMSLTEDYETMEGVLQMRLAQSSDRAAVAQVVGDRCDWMEARDTRHPFGLKATFG